ncbi:hypothetical protein BC1002_3500 [Paraburkholderia atlantica]|uniref:Uncharacterized protein n=1 Tax=Paraburkholderia atlantica TaxID=2654982 RepID=D5WGB4_PARAM|nr:hypothetical protein [Paraburkholderia atlantica]ADG17533.1 hypothetical protein BC1002_3500 [Paraburkholderia atlantica]
MAFAGASAMWWTWFGESILDIANPVWQFRLDAYGADTVDERLDLAFGLSLLVAAVAVSGLLAYGYRQWVRSTGSNFDFYASLLAFDATALLLLANAFWWFEYMSSVINASHPLWTWLKSTYGADRAYRLLDWAFPATSIAILAFVMSGTCYAIASHRRSLV